VLRFCDQQKLKRVILLGGEDAWRVADELKARDIAVIVAGVLALPRRADGVYDDAFTVAGKLSRAGVRFCIADEGGGGGAANARNLPQHAAMAAAFGLDRDEALKSVTLYPARILGVGDRIGSIRTGQARRSPDHRRRPARGGDACRADHPQRSRRGDGVAADAVVPQVRCATARPEGAQALSIIPVPVPCDAPPVLPAGRSHVGRVCAVPLEAGRVAGWDGADPLEGRVIPRSRGMARGVGSSGRGAAR
jgi:hypothetical protein